MHLISVTSAEVPQALPKVLHGRKSCSMPVVAKSMPLQKEFGDDLNCLYSSYHNKIVVEI